MCTKGTASNKALDSHSTSCKYMERCTPKVYCYLFICFTFLQSLYHLWHHTTHNQKLLLTVYSALTDVSNGNVGVSITYTYFVPCTYFCTIGFHSFFKKTGKVHSKLKLNFNWNWSHQTADVDFQYQIQSKSIQ